MSKVEDTIDHAKLVRALLYVPEEGHFISRAGIENQLVAARWKPGRIVGGKDAYHDAKGYIRLRVQGCCVAAHRLIWFYVHGVWPKEQIDHINHVRDDNRLVNLRECTNAENRQNIRPEGYGMSGYLGVYFNKEKRSKPWTSMITVNGKYKHVGAFDTPEEASAAYLAAKAEMHAFATHGISSVGGKN